MNIPLFIGCCFLIVVISVMIALTAIYTGRFKDAQKNQNKWCYADWNCGTNEKVADATQSDYKNSSPVLDQMPTIYTGQLANVYTNPEAKDYSPGPPVPVGGCMCPVQMVFDYKIDDVKTSSTYGKLIKIPVGDPVTSAFYINDNYFNQNPTMSMTSTNPDVPAHPVGGMPACTVQQCMDMWSSPLGLGKFGAALQPVKNSSAVWPVKGYWSTRTPGSGALPNTSKTRKVPDATQMQFNPTGNGSWSAVGIPDVSWDTFAATMGASNKMPTYSVSTILAQTGL